MNKDKFSGAALLMIGFIAAMAFQAVQAWTNPTVAPPSGNVSGPITVGGGTQTKAGKIRSDLTSSGDPSNTLVTKSYVDAAGSSPVRGGLYGGCYQQLSADFVNLYGGYMRWPVTSCPDYGTGDPTCASGYSPVILSFVQGNTGARRTDSAGLSRYDDGLDTYWLTWACAKN